MNYAICLVMMMSQADASVAVANARVNVAQAGPKLPNDFDKGQEQAGAVVTAPAPIEMTVYTMDGCVPCAQMLRLVGNGNERIKLTWSKDQPPAGIPALRPVTVWTSPQGRLTYRVGVSSLEDLVRCYESDLPKAAGAAPLRIRSRIVDAIGKFRQYAGESASIRLDRSGESRFALLEANTKYDLATVMGAYGRVEISCPTTPLVVNKLGCRYSVDGDDLTLDLDPIALRGFGAKLHPTSAVGADPVGVDPGTILTVVTILHGLWQLAHPSCDLELPGSLTCDVTLVGDVMTIKLNGPRIRITAYWQWLLGVDTVIVSPDKIRVEFVNQPGTMWPIKSREWAVTE